MQKPENGLNEKTCKTFLYRCKMQIFVILCLIFKIMCSECANILAVFPTPFISHHAVFRSLTNELVKRGHQVTVITTDPEFSKGQSPQNLTEIDLHDLSYKIWDTAMSSENKIESDSHSRTKAILNTFNAIFEEQMKSSEVQELIADKNKTFDLLIVESCIRVAISLSYIYKVPVIEISSLGPIYQTLDFTGGVINSLHYPTVLRQRVNNLTFLEKLTEMYTLYEAEYSYAQLEKTENIMLKRIFGDLIPDVKELKKNVGMLFMNIHPLWDSNRPVPPNILYLGGMHLKPSKPLEKDLKFFLDSSKQGVIYMSFGTKVKPSLLPPEKLQIFNNVFSQLPYQVLWKWDKDEIPGCSKNINMSKWFPQSDLLKHPNIKLFITQGGLQSTDEAIAAGVPLIGVPMLTDQWYNTEMYMKYKIGVKLDIDSISKESLRHAIETVIDNPIYRENVIKLGNIMRDQPQTSLERAIWWTEHVLRHGNAEHLRTPAAHMHWTEYYALDLVLVLFSFSLIILIILAYTIHLIAPYLYCKINKYLRTRIKTKKN